MEHPFTFKLDSFQEKAIEYISKDENVLITAKTGSGKTLVGEYQIWRSLNKGKRVFYTTPIKSLSNQKFHDLKKNYGNRVGIMTGDIKFSPHADIVIMTTEILRNLLYKQGTVTERIGITADLSLQNLDAVVFDEVHYINDHSRGSVWEECLVLLPPEINLVLLSATLDSPQPFVDWLTTLKGKPCHLISTQHRVVPLVHTTEDGDILMDSKDTFHIETYRKWTRKYYNNQDELRKHKERVQSREEGQTIEKTVRVGSFLERMNQLIVKMDKPALFFVFSRKMCEEYASKVSTDLLTSSETADVKHIVNFHLHKHTELQQMESYHKLFSLLQKGVAFHHSGMLPILKEIVEILFDKGLIKVLFATETFAVGINMPTKTVVFTSFRKFDDEADTMRVLRTSEYIQMAGRAGRRGKDDKGVVIYLPIREPEEPFVVSAMMTGKSASVQSQMKFDISYILATMNSGKSIKDDTYWNSQLEAEKQVLYDEADAIPTPFLERKLYDDCALKDKLQEGFKHSVNAEKKKYQAELSRWENTHMGPVWLNAWSTYLAIQEAKRKIAVITAKVNQLDAPIHQLEKQKEYLKHHGYIENDKLTMKGLMASEVHEGHPILMTELYESKLLEGVSVGKVVETLSCFLEEPKTEELIPKTQPIDLLRDIATSMEIREPITDYWVEIVHEWLNQSNFVCEAYGIEQGNFVRAMLKLANVVREWVSMATIKQDTEMIEKMTGIEQKIVRDFVLPDSLYLRI
jgi:superfamily II RNA helicase